jgi:FkbM family methyltransferase
MRAMPVRRLLRRLGVDLVRYDERHSAELRRRSVLAGLGIDVVIDVGANDGPYAAALRADGFAGRIISFEPQAEAFARLERRASDDPLWEARRCAAGAERGRATLNVSGNSSSSSLLAIEERHVSSAPESAFVASETVDVVRLDDLDLVGAEDRALLKLDVQGYELEALHGAEQTLERVVAVDTELSLVPLYQGAPLLPEVMSYLLQRGFKLVGLEPVFLDPADGAVLQLDGLFVRAQL